MSVAEEIRTWELRPRCLVVVPGLTFDEFAEGPWASVKGTHESVNFWTGDALVYLDQFGEKGSQLFDENLTPARMAQLKWVAEAIPLARRRDDCSWTMHRLVAGLFNRRRGIFPAAYLDRKAELQDDLLARAAKGKWHSESMATAIADLETEALASITRRNEPPENDDRHDDGDLPIPEPAEAVEAVERSEALSRPDQREIVETEVGQTSGCGSAAHVCPERAAISGEPAGSDNPVSHGEAGGSPVAMSIFSPSNEAAKSDAVVGPSGIFGRLPDRAELRACIEAVRAASPFSPVADPARIASALGRPSLDIGSTDRVLSTFSPGWRCRMEEQLDDRTGVARWSVAAAKADRQRAMGLNAILPYALAEAALAAMLSDMPPEEMPVREPVVAPLRLEPTRAEPIIAAEPETELLTAYHAISPADRPKARKWVLHGSVHDEPAPPCCAAAFEALWIAASEDDRKPFRVVLVKEPVA